MKKIKEIFNVNFNVKLKMGGILAFLVFIYTYTSLLYSQEITINDEVRERMLHDFQEYLKSKDISIDSKELLSENRKSMNIKPRFEERRVNDQNVQLALIFSNTEMRDDFFKSTGDQYSDFKVVKAGSTTVEVSIKGVDKALAINFLAHHLKEILPEEDQTSLWKNQSVFISDADGTIYAKPVEGRDHFLFSLDKSPTVGPLKDYLKKGGVAAIISGNDIYRVLERINRGFADDEAPLKKRLLIFANGAATLFTYVSGEWREFTAYRHLALQDPTHSLADRDFIYVGDDHKIDGNDYPGLNKVGSDRAFCVSPQVMSSAIAISVPEFEEGTAKILMAINKLLEEQGSDGTPLFSHLKEIFSKDI